MMTSITLTVKDLIEICQFMGQPEKCKDHWEEWMDEDEYESSLTIHYSVRGIEVWDDDNKIESYTLAVTCDGCGPNEVQPIGDPING